MEQTSGAKRVVTDSNSKPERECNDRSHRVERVQVTRLMHTIAFDLVISEKSY